MHILASLLGTAALAAAHGYVDNATIGGSFYEFYQPYTDPYMSNPPDRVSRSIPGNGPVTDVSIIDIQCNAGAEPAALHAPANAGSTATLHWTLWPESHVGPVITYMARCPDSGCDSWEPGTQAVWFKIQEEGRHGTSTVWASTPIMTPGHALQYTIPSCLASGYYLVRHETIALHASSSYPGAQFYPGCHQLKVSGSGSTKPSNLVSFPGAYHGSDSGITYNVYQAATYEIPGPDLFSC